MQHSINIYICLHMHIHVHIVKHDDVCDNWDLYREIERERAKEKGNSVIKSMKFKGFCNKKMGKNRNSFRDLVN